jgi:hypothetical protein
VARWRRLIDRYLFWALTYEVGLHFRSRSPRREASQEKTLFEIMDYRLTPEQFAHTLAQMKTYRTGVTEHAAYAAVSALVALRLTRPLGWIIEHQSTVRAVLGLR